MANHPTALPGPIGFGGAPLGDMFGKVDEETATATLEAAWDSGIRYYDVAPHYGCGLAEHRFGAVLRQKTRDEYVLSTKVGRMLEPSTEPEISHPFLSALPFRRRWDYSGDAARRSIEDSLQRMAVGRIDIVFVHDLATDHHGGAYEDYYRTAAGPNGAFPALSRLRDEGVIKGWGLGVNLPDPCVRALKDSDPDIFLLAGRYSLIDFSGLDELFPLCAERGARIVVGGPYNSGLLAGGTTFDYEEAKPAQVKARDRILEVCKEFGVDIKAAALQFCAAHPVVASVIPGAKDPDRVKENAALMQARVPAGFWSALKERGLLPNNAPTPAESPKGSPGRGSQAA